MPSLFDPVTFGSLHLPNRIIMAPLTRGRAGPSRIPNDLMAEYYAQRASAGLIISEATAISRMGYGWYGAPALYTDAHLQGWKNVTHAVHAAGGRIVLQLWHMGRVSHPDVLDGDTPLAPSAIRAQSGQASTPTGRKDFVTPRAMTLDEITTTIDDYARGARMAIEAGFDGVEIHGAHGYLIDQFIRDGSNHRHDDYGGSLENRLRFPLAVVAAVVAAIGANKTGIRISPTQAHNDMHDSDPRTTFGTLVARLHDFNLAFLHIREDVPTTKDAESGYLTPYLRTLYKGPVMVNGGYSRDLALEAVASGMADAVAFGRPFISNPDLVQRLKDNVPLALPDTATMYGGSREGYTDYPVAA